MSALRIAWLLALNSILSSFLMSAPGLALGSELTVEDVILLHEAGLGDEVVIGKLQQTGKVFDLGVDQLIALKRAGISEDVIKTMMDPSAAEPRSAGRLPLSPAVTSLRREMGVYIKREGDYVLLEPEPVNWRTGGTLKRIGTLGLHKGHLNGTVRGYGADEYFSGPLELLIVTQEGEYASEYQLLRLDVKDDLREFRALTGGVVRTRTDSDRNFVPFEAEKTGPQTYTVALPDLERGEYGLLPPSATVSKIFTFGVE